MSEWKVCPSVLRFITDVVTREKWDVCLNKYVTLRSKPTVTPRRALDSGGQGGERLLWAWWQAALGLCDERGAYLRVSVHHLVLLDHLPADLAAVVHDGVHLCPRPELPLPVGDGGEWGDDEERAVDAPEEYFWKERDGLAGFP